VTLGIMMFLILWRMRDHKHAEGWLFGVYCILAGIERFTIEFFRAKDDTHFLGPLTAAQTIALIFLIAGTYLVIRKRDVTPTAPGIYATGTA
jgi:phosphatidylglycerol:prolipoprotein diacylglycerol transferase